MTKPRYWILGGLAGLSFLMFAASPVALYYYRYRPIDIASLQFPFDREHGRIEDIPQSIRNLDGHNVAIVAEMVPMETSKFALVPKAFFFDENNPPPQSMAICVLPPNKTVGLYYITGRLRVLGTIHIEVTRNDSGDIISLYRVNAQSAKYESASDMPFP